MMKKHVLIWLGFACLAAFISVSFFTGEIGGFTRSGKWVLFRREGSPIGFYAFIALSIALILTLRIVKKRDMKKREKIPHYPREKKPIQLPETKRGM